MLDYIIKLPKADDYTIYKWDKYKNKLITDFLSFKDVSDVQSNDEIIMSIRSIIENDFDNIYSLNKMFLDRTTVYGQKLHELIEDILPYYFTIEDKPGVITIITPYLAAYANEWQNQHQGSKTDKLDYIIITDNIEAIKTYKMGFELVFSEDRHEFNKNFTMFLNNIYAYLNLYTDYYSETALMCPKCYKSYNKLKGISLPLFATTSIYDIKGKHQCSYCNYEGEDFTPIDSHMAKLVWKLNSNGIRTIACCAGHTWYDYDIYIMFDDSMFDHKDSNGKYIMSKHHIDEDQIYEYFDEMFKFEYDPDNGSIVCRFNFDLDYRIKGGFELNDSFEIFSKRVCDSMYDLFLWIMNGYKLKESSKETNI